MEVVGVIIALLGLLATILGLPVLERWREKIKRGKEKTKLLEEQKRIKETQPNFQVIFSRANRVVRLLNIQSPACKLSFVAFYFVGLISLASDKHQVASQETVTIFLGDDFDSFKQ